MTIYTIFATILLAVSLFLMYSEIKSYREFSLSKDEDFLHYSKRRFKRRMMGIFFILVIVFLIYLNAYMPSLTNTLLKLWRFLGICFTLVMGLFILSFLDLRETVNQINKGKEKLLDNSSEELKKFLLDINEKKNSIKSNEKTFTNHKNNNN